VIIKAIGKIIELKNIVNVGANENISSNFHNINKNIFGIIVNNKTIFKISNKYFLLFISFIFLGFILLESDAHHFEACESDGLGKPKLSIKH
jgi:hypothetical protein